MTVAYTAGLDCIVDASVGIKLFLVESLSEQTEALFAHLGVAAYGDGG